MMQQGTMSTNRITIRGIGSRTPYHSNRIKAYWGEMPLTDGDGATSIEDIGLNDISQLEVLKGAASSLYGAGMGGVIMLRAFSNEYLKDGVKIKSELGSFQRYSQHFQLSKNVSDKGYLALVGGLVKMDGYRQNSNYKRYNITAKAQQSIGNNYWSVLYNFRYLNGQIPSSLDSISFIDNPQKAAASWSNIGGYEENLRHLLSVGLVSPIANKLVNGLTVFGKASSLTELRPFNQLKENRYAYGLRDKLTLATDKLKTTIGIEFMFENNDVALFSVKENDLGRPLSNANYHRYYTNVFGLVEYYPSPRLIGQIAFNINQTGYRIDSQTEGVRGFNYNYIPVVSPRVGVNYQVHKYTHIFAAIGHGFSAPSMEEAQLPDGSFNKQIKPEEGANYELGLRYGNSNHEFYADFTMYLMKMKNLLVTERDAEDQFYGKNAGETTHYGLEALLKYALFKPTKTRALDFTLSYFISFNKFDHFIDNGSNYKGNHLPGIPNANLSIDVLARLKSINFSIDHKYIGRQYLNDKNTKQLSGYHKTNAKMSVDFNIHKLKTNVYLGVDNIFNTHYASMVVINAKSFGNNLPRYYYPGLPFNVFGGVEVAF